MRSIRGTSGRGCGRFPHNKTAMASSRREVLYFIHVCEARACKGEDTGEPDESEAVVEPAHARGRFRVGGRAGIAA